MLYGFAGWIQGGHASRHSIPLRVIQDDRQCRQLVRPLHIVSGQRHCEHVGAIPQGRDDLAATIRELRPDCLSEPHAKTARTSGNESVMPMHVQIVISGAQFIDHDRALISHLIQRVGDQSRAYRRPAPQGRYRRFARVHQFQMNIRNRLSTSIDNRRFVPETSIQKAIQQFNGSSGIAGYCEARRKAAQRIGTKERIMRDMDNLRAGVWLHMVRHPWNSRFQHHNDVGSLQQLCGHGSEIHGMIGRNIGMCAAGNGNSGIMR